MKVRYESVAPVGGEVGCERDVDPREAAQLIALGLAVEVKTSKRKSTKSKPKQSAAGKAADDRAPDQGEEGK